MDWLACSPFHIRLVTGLYLVYPTHTCRCVHTALYYSCGMLPSPVHGPCGYMTLQLHAWPIWSSASQINVICLSVTPFIIGLPSGLSTLILQPISKLRLLGDEHYTDLHCISVVYHILGNACRPYADNAHATDSLSLSLSLSFSFSGTHAYSHSHSHTSVSFVCTLLSIRPLDAS